ncbi:fasciclin domain-containing protein [Halotalea alkalilenta]|uniref:fasciclin domain-containing protein n=1 Tax=Halotalea alkalilenta TaxID=376489 RepID=UPI00047FBF16|nr:fasciclin domain-containing protein [Halotalea alkalilenta]
MRLPLPKPLRLVLPLLPFAMLGVQPAAAADVLELARQDGRFTRFIEMAEASGLSDRLEGRGPFTVFIPVDEGFAELEPAQAQRLDSASHATLERWVAYHAVPALIVRDEVVHTPVVPALTQQLRLVDDGERFSVNGREVIEADLRADNGVIHVIDAPLVPHFPY